MKKLAFILILLALILSACNLSLAADITPPPGYQAPAVMPQAQPQSVAFYPLVAPNPGAGAEIYAEKCAPCHGTSGLGDGERAADLPNPVTPLGTVEVARLATPVEWYTIVTQGNLERFMPPFPSLNDRQRWDVVAYALTLNPDAQQVEKGQAIYQADCASCHGETGKGDGPSAGGLTLPDFSDQEFMAARSTNDFYQAISNGVEPGMPAFAEQLSEDERWALTAYLRSLSFTAGVEQTLVEQQTQELAPPAASVDPSLDATAVISETLNSGVITGHVTNASGGDFIVGTEVMLHGFDAMQLAISQTAQLAEDGSFTFPGIELKEGLTFFTTLQHQGVTYGSEFITIEQGQESLDLPILIYDTTSDTSALKIDRLHLFLEQLDDKTIRVAELYIMSNLGDKTIVAPNPGEPSITFALPAEAQDLQFQNGELGGRFVKTAQGFGDTASIYPGASNYQILLAYTIPYNRKLQFSKEMSLPSDAIVVLAPKEGIKVKGQNLVEAGTQDVSGVSYQLYNLDGLASGQSLELTVSNQLSLPGGNTSNLVIGLTALGLALLLGGVYLFWRNRQAEKLDEEDELDDLSASDLMDEETPEALMDAILALDDLYHQGEIQEDAYIQRRAELKSRLKQVLGEE